MRCTAIVALFLTTACVRMGFDNTTTLPPVQVDPGERKISVLHASAMQLGGRCTEIGGTIDISGDSSGSTLCVPGGSWTTHLDFSSAPDGPCTIFIVQHDAAGNYSSPPLEVQVFKDTAVCSNTGDTVPFAGGSGTAADPYLICDGTQLAAIGSHLGAHIRLENDVDVGDETWSWFGTLSGSLDGNGFVIENLTYDTDSQPTGLFSRVSGTIKNLGVVDANIYSYCHVGLITGILLDGGVIESSYATGILQSYSDAVGGLVGQNAGTIINSFANVDVTDTGSFCVGGLVGVTDAGGSISGSYSVGEVQAFGADRVGGLVGCNNGALENSYALGAVPANNASTVIGGLVGKNTGSIENTFAAGLVRGGVVGGLLANNTGSVTASYWDTAVSGQAESHGGAGLDTAEMSDAASFDGWDFDSVWRLDPESPYPVLGWQ